MAIPIAVLGAGGFGREVLDVVEAINAEGRRFEIVAVLSDPAPDGALLDCYEVPHLGGISELSEMSSAIGYIVAIGNPAAKRTIDSRFKNRSCPVLIHPSATVGRQVTIGPGTVVCAGVRITNHVTIGRHVHLNLNSTVGHDAVLDDFVTVSPLVAVSGKVRAAEGAFLGTGATINPGLELGKNCVIGSGAVVARNVEHDTQVVGVPARPRP